VPALLALADDLDPAQDAQRRLGLRERAFATAAKSEWWWQQPDTLSTVVESRIAAGDAQGAHALVAGWLQGAGAKPGQRVEEWFPALQRAADTLASTDKAEATAVCEHILAAFQAAPDGATLPRLGQLGDAAQKAGATVVARAVLELARTPATAQLASAGWSHELDSIAELALAVDDYALAEQIRLAAVDASEKRSDAAGSIEARRLLAEVLDKASRHDEARVLYEQVFAAREAGHGPDSVEAAGAALAVAECLKSTERWKDALPWYERAAAGWAKALGTDSFAHAWGLEQVAFVHNKLGEAAAALPLYEKALAIRLAAAKDGNDAVLSARIFEDTLGWPDKAAVARVASLLREQLEQRPALAHRDLYRRLWKAETRVADSNQLPDLRRRLLADIERIRAARAEDEAGSWLMLQSAYETLGDEANVRATSAEIARRFPCAIGAFDRVSNWKREHPEPPVDAVDRGAWVAGRLAATSAWVAECPDEAVYWAQRLAAVRAAAKPRAEDVEAAADGLLRAWRLSPEGTMSVPAWEAAMAYVEARTRLAEVPRLVAVALLDSEREFRKNTTLKRQHERDQILGSALVAEAAVRSGDVDAAGKMLLELKGHIEAGAHEEWWGHYLRLLGLVQAARGHRSQAAVLYARARERDDAEAKQELDGLIAGDPSLREVAMPEGATRAWSNDGGDAGLLAWVEALPRPQPEPRAPEWKEQSRPLPELRMRDLSGREWHEKDLLGSFTVVNIWASWCQPCVTELPELQRLHERLPPGKRRPRVITINVDPNPLLVEPFLKRLGLTFPVLMLGADAAETFAPVAIPTTLIVDPEGTVRRQRVGFLATEKDTVGRILAELRALGAPLKR
jgi:thiol-disulfide isomerase/thioredoxin